MYSSIEEERDVMKESDESLEQLFFERSVHLSRLFTVIGQIIFSFSSSETPEKILYFIKPYLSQLENEISVIRSSIKNTDGEKMRMCLAFETNYYCLGYLSIMNNLLSPWQICYPSLDVDADVIYDVDESDKLQPILIKSIQSTARILSLLIANPGLALDNENSQNFNIYTSVIISYLDVQYVDESNKIWSLFNTAILELSYSIDLVNYKSTELSNVFQFLKNIQMLLTVDFSYKKKPTFLKYFGALRNLIVKIIDISKSSLLEDPEEIIDISNKLLHRLNM
jgi:hypothetical protein